MLAFDSNVSSGSPTIRVIREIRGLAGGLIDVVGVYLARLGLTRLTAWATPRASIARTASNARSDAHAVKLIFRNLDFFICRGWRIWRGGFRLRG